MKQELELSLVIPVFNEAENLDEMVQRSLAVCKQSDRSFEIILVDDGSMDGSTAMITQAARTYCPEVIGVLLNRNYGQHAAVFAGLAQSRGDIVITLDADLQNPSEEIPKLLKEMEKDVDVVGTVRTDRRDSLFRKYSSSLVNSMVRRATSLHGWDILLRGTIWSGPVIGNECADSIRRTAEAGHEIGLHAWDHHRWQAKIAGMDRVTVRSELEKGKSRLEEIIKQPVTCSAVPGWRCTDVVLEEKEQVGFRYNSDCRGHSLYYPQVGGVQLSQSQVPVTLPTYDELIGVNGIDERNYNNHLLALFSPERLNALTIHAEVERISCLQMFQEFLKKARSRNIVFKPLRELLQGDLAIESCPNGTANDGWAGRVDFLSARDESRKQP